MKTESLFRIAKRTKNTVRYNEVEAPGTPIAIGAIYIKKDAISGEIPEEIVVTVRGL